LNLTKDWRADWGGLLHFVNDNNVIEEVQVPSFNTLALFKVPTRHFVSYVSDYATAKRYAVTGWLFAPG
jgi:Rps23 Pro-64 3,4-dihydroxylase Tpa1-like proline 4-hydroxylase